MEKPQFYNIQVTLGSAMNVPVRQRKGTADNWMARISPRTGAYSLDREFMERGFPGYYETLSLRMGDAVEFGADYYDPERVYVRWYGVVRLVADNQIVLQQCANANEAFLLSDYIRKPDQQPSPVTAPVETFDASEEVRQKVSQALSVSYSRTTYPTRDACDEALLTLTEICDSITNAKVPPMAVHTTSEGMIYGVWQSNQVRVQVNFYSWKKQTRQRPVPQAQVIVRGDFSILEMGDVASIINNIAWNIRSFGRKVRSKKG